MMFGKFLGLPVHPLIVHAAVVLVPLLALTSSAYAAMPRVRQTLAWPVTALALAGPAAAVLARQSGLAFAQGFLSGEGLRLTQFGRRIIEHENFGLPTVLITIMLGAGALLLVATTSDVFGRRLWPRSHRGFAVITLLAATAATYYIARAGHSGAAAVWSR